MKQLFISPLVIYIFCGIDSIFLKWLHQSYIPEVYLEPCRTSTVELFCKKKPRLLALSPLALSTLSS